MGVPRMISTYAVAGTLNIFLDDNLMNAGTKAKMLPSITAKNANNKVIPKPWKRRLML
jgi:hypothetical protein